MAPDDNRNLRNGDANIRDILNYDDDAYDGDALNEAGAIIYRNRILEQPGHSFEHIKAVLNGGMHQYFNEFDIDVVSCPCLTRPPYNLKAVGLSGNTMTLITGVKRNVLPVPQPDKQYHIRRILLEYCCDSFIIGTGFAARPNMPCNGYLTMNASISSRRNVVNDSHIVYEEDNNQSRKLELLSAPNQMLCSMYGAFFVSEGRPGMVIKVRAKRRKSEFDFVSAVQRCLRACDLLDLTLGGVLKINGGQILQHVIRENYPARFGDYPSFIRSGKIYTTECHDLIAVGTIGNEVTDRQEKIENFVSYESRFKFNTFSNGEMGEYINDIAPNDTEYIGYFNMARKNVYF